MGVLSQQLDFVFWWNLLIYRQILRSEFLLSWLECMALHVCMEEALLPEASLSLPCCSTHIYEMLNQPLGNLSCAVSWLLFLLGLLCATFYPPDTFPGYKRKLPPCIRVCIFPKLSNISRKPWNNNLLLILLTHNEYFIPRWTWVLNLKDHVVPNFKLGNEIYLNYIEEGSD